MIYQNYFWDFDGTLFDTYPRMTRACMETLSRLGIHTQYDELLKIMKVSLREVCRRYAPLAHTDAQTMMDMYHRIEIEQNTGFDTMQPYVGAPEMCAEVCAHGGRNFLFTHRNHTALDALAHFKLTPFFADVVTADDHFPAKPAPDALNYLLKKHKLSADTCAMLGDRDIDLGSGVNAGMHTVLFDPEGFYPAYPADHHFTDFAAMCQTLVTEK